MSDVRRFNPNQPRDPGGKDGGKWIKNPATAVSDFTDGLGLDGRIELDPGDLVGSSSSVGDETDDADLNWVVVFSKEYGPEARIGVTPKEQSNDWAGNPETDDVAIFDAESIAKIRTKLAAHVAVANKAARDADKAWRAGSPPTDPKLLGSEAVASGEAIGAEDLADLAWDIYLTDDDPTSWQLNVKTNPDSEGINLGPKGAKDLLANLDTIEGELRGPSPAEEVTAAQRSARRTRTPRRAMQSRYSPNQKRDPDGEWGDGTPGRAFDLQGLTAVQHLEGTFGDLVMGVDAAGDVRLAFHEGGNARELDLSAGDVDEMGNALGRLVGEREQLDGDLPSDELVDDQWFGDVQQHRVALYGSGVIQVAFGAEEEDPWTLSLDPPDDEAGDDVETFLGGVDAVLAEAATRSGLLRTEVRGTAGHVFEDGICISCADDEPDGPLDEQAQALLAAISELGPASRAFNPAVHPRNPKGAAGGGRFRSNVDKLKDAIKAHKAGDGKGDPFEGFDREQLRRVAKARGIELKRGEGRDSIAGKLKAHLGGGANAASEKQPTSPSTGTTIDAKTLSEGAQNNHESTMIAAKRLADSWKVDDADLEALAREDGIWSHLADLSARERREQYADSLIRRSQGSSGGPEMTAALTAVVDRLGGTYELDGSRARINEYIRSDPAMGRATASLGEAMYRQTQEWFKERGITHVRAYRATPGLDIDAKQPFTSWSTGKGTIRLDGDREIRDEAIPVERIAAIPTTGFGSIDELELIVLHPSVATGGTAAEKQ